MIKSDGTIDRKKDVIFVIEIEKINFGIKWKYVVLSNLLFFINRKR